MDDPLASIHASCEAIKGNRFPAPGIFTNAILSKPEVTTLIRDAHAPEQSLYKITRSGGLSSSMVRNTHPSGTYDDNDAFLELNPERIDGKSIYAEPEPSATHTTAVRVPRLVQTPSQESDPIPEELSSPTKRRLASQYHLISPEVIESDDINVMCAAVCSVLDQYPSYSSSQSLRDTVASLQSEYKDLVRETDTLERTVADQKQRLDHYNDSLSQLSPRKGNISPQRTLTIDERIEREEAEIQRLESELNDYNAQ